MKRAKPRRELHGRGFGREANFHHGRRYDHLQHDERRGSDGRAADRRRFLGPRSSFGFRLDRPQARCDLPCVVPSIISVSIDPQLARVVFWIAVACCAVAQAAIVRAALRPPGGGGETAAGGTVVPRPSRASELAWTLVPAVALCAVLAVTWRALGR